MASLKFTPSPFLNGNPKSPNLHSHHHIKPYSSTCCTSSNIKPPPPGFNFRSSDIFSESCTAITALHPDLLDFANSGCLILVQKNQFGPVPHWRAGFVEPDQIWLLGTTHIDRASPLHVDRVVRALKPDNVVVELCRSRAGIMYTSSSNEPGPQQLRSNMFSLSGAEFFGAIGRSINLGGQTALVLRLLLAIFSSKVSSDIDRPFGDEFRAARVVSEEIGAQIVLGDRPIEITLERAWNSLKWTEKLSLVNAVFRGIASASDTSRDNVKEAGTDDSPYQLYEKLSVSYPSLVQPLIHERDTVIIFIKVYHYIIIWHGR